jgi:hypothetical protein
VRSAYNIKGNRFRTVGREKDLKMQNSSVMNKEVITATSEFYGVTQ